HGCGEGNPPEMASAPTVRAANQSAENLAKFETIHRDSWAIRASSDSTQKGTNGCRHRVHLTAAPACGNVPLTSARREVPRFALGVLITQVRPVARRLMLVVPFGALAVVVLS